MKRLDLQRDGLSACARAVCSILEQPGAVLLLPTETVYGLVARAGDTAAREKIFQLKHRPSNKVLGHFARDRAALLECGAELSDEAEALLKRYTPGPLTLILPCGNTTLGVRLPDHPLLQQVLQQSGELLVQTSANRSGAPNPRTVGDALEQLDGTPDLVIDGGEIPADAQGSTVVDLTGPERKILRQGVLILK